MSNLVFYLTGSEFWANVTMAIQMILIIGLIAYIVRNQINTKGKP